MVFFSAALYAGVGTPGEGVPSDKTLLAAFLEFEGGCRSGNVPGTLAALKEIEAWELQQGRQDIFPVTDALFRVYRKSTLYKNGSRHERIAILEGIRALSPDDPGLQWTLLKDRFLSAPFAVGSLFEGMRGLGTSVTHNLGWAWNRGGQILLSLIFALFLTVFWFALIMLLKYLPALLFQMRQLLRFTDSLVLAGLCAMTLLLLPVYFQVGLVWWFLFCLVILWLFLSKREKMVVLILLFLLSFLSLEMKNVGKFLTAASNQDTYLLYLANYSFLDPVGFQKLKKEATKANRDADILFTLGLHERRKGNYAAAEKYYQAALWAEPSFVECMNNLANVYFLSRVSFPDNLTLARIWYRKAIKNNPNKAELYYNLGQSYPPLDSARVRYLIKARVLDPALVDRLSNLFPSLSKHMLMDCRLPVDRLWSRGFSPSVTASEFSLLFWRFYLKAPQDRIFFMPAVLFFLLFLLFRIRHRFPRVVPCYQCGRFYAAEYIEQGAASLCPTCRMLKKHPDQSDPELVNRKIREVALYQRKKKLVILFAGFFPAGGGLLWEKRVFTGVCTAFMFYWVMSYCIITHQYFSNMSLWFYGYSSHSLSPFILAVLLYAVSLIPPVSALVRREI